MKPRQRLEQKQSARLYARGKDHRDILFYDDANSKYIYHNALYWTEEDENAVNKEHIAWVKYPKNAIYHMSNVCGWMDVDRQFNYAYRDFGQTYNITYYLEEPDITVMICGNVLRNANIYWTKDGIVWHDITPSGGITWFTTWQILRFGRNGLCNVTPTNGNVSSGYYTVIKMLFEYDEDTDEVTYTYATNTYITTYSRARYLCNTQHGIIVYEGSSSGGDNPTYYAVYSHIIEDGSRTTTEQSMGNRSIIGQTPRALSYCRHDNHCAVILYGESYHGQYSGNVEQCVEVMVTHDNGNTWHGATISDITTNSSSYVGDSVDIFYRNGYFYAIYSIYVLGRWKTHMYKSQYGITWEEVILPTWVDLPLIQGGGTGVATPASDTLRIAIDPQSTSNYDVSMNTLIPYYTQNLGMHNLRGGNFALGNILYQDGEITPNDSFWYLMGVNSTYHVYFDIEQLEDTSKAFAWQQASYLDTPDIPDTVQPNDYCVRGE